MEYMAGLPDKAFDLAVVDPPYGIGINHNMGRRRGDKHSGHKKVKWDSTTPDDLYFTQLFRVSKNQIIWGGNYFDLPLVGSWIVWDKLMPFDLSFSQCELAWMSFGNVIKKVSLRHHGFINGDSAKIHPTQKPIKLYKWLLHNYAKPGDKILDTHLGSGSSAIAAHNMGFDFVGCELDTDYYNAACKRFKEQTQQLKLL